MNLGGISSTLFESEMFGHVRGAFTDARADRKGRFEVAHGGTIFLDEIGDLDPPSQVKMLRVLQDRTFEVLGSSQRREVDVRVVSATNRPLADDGRARRVPRGPALPHQPDRHPPAAAARAPGRHADARVALPADAPAQVYRREPLTLSSAALRWLQAQPWPGNVRQLRQGSSARCWSARAIGSRSRTSPSRSSRRGASRRARRCPPVGSMTMDEIERAMIVKSLRHHGGNISKVAESLGLSRAALYRRFEKYEITV